MINCLCVFRTNLKTQRQLIIIFWGTRSFQIFGGTRSFSNSLWHSVISKSLWHTVISHFLWHTVISNSLWHTVISNSLWHMVILNFWWHTVISNFLWHTVILNFWWHTVIHKSRINHFSKKMFSFSKWVLGWAFIFKIFFFQNVRSFSKCGSFRNMFSFSKCFFSFFRKKRLWSFMYRGSWELEKIG